MSTQGAGRKFLEKLLQQHHRVIKLLQQELRRKKRGLAVAMLVASKKLRRTGERTRGIDPAG